MVARLYWWKIQWIYRSQDIALKYTKGELVFAHTSWICSELIVAERCLVAVIFPCICMCFSDVIQLSIELREFESLAPLSLRCEEYNEPQMIRVAKKFIVFMWLYFYKLYRLTLAGVYFCVSYVLRIKCLHLLESEIYCGFVQYVVSALQLTCVKSYRCTMRLRNVYTKSVE